MKKMQQWGGLESPPDDPLLADDQHEDEGAYADDCDHDHDEMGVEIAERRYEAGMLGLG